MSAFALLVAIAACLAGGIAYAIAARGGSPPWASFGVGLLMFVVVSMFLPLAIR